MNLISPTRACIHPIRQSILRVFTSRHSTTGNSEDEIRAARQWLAQLNPKIIPREICQISFSRSSGPGGQNVNKVNSKATLRIPFQSLLPFVPRIVHSSLRSSRYAADRSQCLVIQSDESRRRTANVESCYDKLYRLLENSARSAIHGEPSEAQRERVQKL